MESGLNAYGPLQRAKSELRMIDIGELIECFLLGIRSKGPRERSQQIEALAKICGIMRADPSVIRDLLFKSATEFPNNQDAWFNLAILFEIQEDWPNCLAACVNGLRVTRTNFSRTDSFEVQPWVELLEKCCSQLKMSAESVQVLMSEVSFG